MNSPQSLYGQETRPNSEKETKEDDDEQEICLEKTFQVQSLQIQELSQHHMVYLHGDFVLCFAQFGNQGIARKFHHSNVFRQVRQVCLWKSSLLDNSKEQQSFVEAIVEKSLYSKQDYLEIAQKLIFQGTLQLENAFGEGLIRWYQRGCSMIKSIENQNSQFSNELIEQESLYAKDLLEKIYSRIEYEQLSNDLFQYNIIELNRGTQQFEHTRIGISFGLQCLLGAELNVAQNVIMRNGVLEYLDNRTVLNFMCKQLSQSDFQNAQFPMSPPSLFDYYEVLYEDQAIISTLDDLTIPCKVTQYILKIEHNLLQKYPLVKKAWEEIATNQKISLPFPDLVCVQMRNIEVEPFALQQLIHQRTQHTKNLEKNIEDLNDEIGYSIRSMYFIEKFYNDLTFQAKKKRLRRKKGNLNDWKYLQYKYEDYKQKQMTDDDDQELLP